MIEQPGEPAFVGVLRGCSPMPGTCDISLPARLPEQTFDTTSQLSRRAILDYVAARGEPIRLKPIDELRRAKGGDLKSRQVPASQHSMRMNIQAERAIRVSHLKVTIEQRPLIAVKQARRPQRGWKLWRPDGQSKVSHGIQCLPPSLVH